MNSPNRRNFIKCLGLSSVFIASSKRVYARDLNTNRKQILSIKSADEMRPGEILKAIQKGPYAYIPISPTFEWHSFHLPMGTDALIPQELSKIAAEKSGGVWFRPLSLGLDSWRGPEEKKRWGFNPDEEFFGMNFPDLPLGSEYCEKNELIGLAENRIKALGNSGIKHVFLINHHGGRGQFATIDQIAINTTSDQMKVHSLRTYQFNDLTENDGWIGIGGHAGISETTWLAAFRPDLVDLDELQDGKLSVRHTGILHSKPEIEEELNPVNISFEVAELLKERVTANFIDYITECKILSK